MIDYLHEYLIFIGPDAVNIYIYIHVHMLQINLTESIVNFAV